MSLIHHKHLATLLIFACFVLFPVARSVELPVLIMAVGGMVLAYKGGAGFFRMPAARDFSLLAACIWIPMLVSLPDSYSVKDTGGAVLAFARLYFAGLFAVWALQDGERVALLVRLLAGLAAFWAGDALFQVAVGHDLFGYAQVPSRLNGVFGERHWRLGVALPVLAPFLVLSLRRRTVLMILALLGCGAVVLMGGSRGGWVSYAVVCAALILVEVQRRKVALWKTLAFAALLLTLGAVLAFLHPGTRARLDQTLLLFSGDEAKMDKALSSRLTLWKDATDMLKAHPVNGVGVRAFSLAYPEFAKPGDPFIQPTLDEESGKRTGASYAHQLVLEVSTETGLIGLAGLLAFFALLLKRWWTAEAGQRLQALPFALAALAWLFPFNTHSSFYSAQWSVLVWLVVALLCGALATPQSRLEAGPNRGTG